MKAITGVAAVLTLAAAVAACSTSTRKADPYCPAVVHVLPRSAPQDSNTALADMSQLTAPIPSGKDHQLGSRVLAVEAQLEAIGKAEIGMGQPDATQLASYYASVTRLKSYCQGT